MLASWRAAWGLPDNWLERVKRASDASHLLAERCQLFEASRTPPARHLFAHLIYCCDDSLRRSVAPEKLQEALPVAELNACQLLLVEDLIDVASHQARAGNAPEVAALVMHRLVVVLLRLRLGIVLGDI